MFQANFIGMINDVKENQVAFLARKKKGRINESIKKLDDKQRTFPSQEIQTVQNIGYCKLREN